MKKKPVESNYVYFYYIRGARNQPVACAAITEVENGKIARGISICSKRDRFNKPAARQIAAYRLQVALASQLSVPFAKYAGKHATRPVEADEVPELRMKMSYGIKPTLYENRILHKPESN